MRPRNALTLGPAALCAAVLAACASDPPVTPPAAPMIRLARTADGAIRVELAHVDVPVRAVEVELEASGGGAITLEDAAPPPGVPLDQVRVRMIGANHAVLFAGDTRGVRITGDGEVARVRARASSGGAADGTLSLARAVVVGADGAPILVARGAALPLR